MVSLTVETCSVAEDVSFATNVKVYLVRTSSTVSVPQLHFSQLLQKINNNDVLIDASVTNSTFLAA